MAFPCLDEPSLKAKFSMSMVREKQHITLFNTLLKKTGPFSGDLVIDEYEETVKMSTYLVAFVVCDYKYISATTESGVQVRILITRFSKNLPWLLTLTSWTFCTYFHYPIDMLHYLLKCCINLSRQCINLSIYCINLICCINLLAHCINE